MRLWRIAVTVAILVVLLFGGILLVLQSSQPANSAAARYTYTVVNVYPHDTNAFTEGLVVQGGFLYESTGLYGSSSLRLVDLETGSVLQETAMPSQFFGEGIAILDGTIVQLTWREHTGFVYDKASFSLLGNFSFSGEGWGTTYDGSCLIVSNGTDTLQFLDPVTHQNVKEVQVRDGNAAVTNLNELEYVKGDVYANIWHQQKIAVINPQTGRVKAWVDLAGLQSPTVLNSESVLNGIAYDAENDRLFVTGKNWPQLFEIKLASE
jgi:glutamine cyclotransferase